MKCPYCAHLEDKVVDSRSKRGGLATRRRRECLDCGERFTTYEYIEESPLMLTKSDGRIEPYDRSKLKRGISLAVVKRSISTEVRWGQHVGCAEICHELGKQEISSADLGAMVMARLKELDEVAYIRFASVYRQFKDIGEFRKELDSL